MIRWFLISFLWNVSLFAQSIPFFYEKHLASSDCEREQKLVDHAKQSFERAMKLESKLTGHVFCEINASKQWRKKAIPYAYLLSDLPKVKGYHLLNNLCSLPQASHLHVGLLAGDSWIGALYENQPFLSFQIGIDWFKECPGAYLSFLNNDLCDDFEQIFTLCSSAILMQYGSRHKSQKSAQNHRKPHLLRNER